MTNRILLIILQLAGAVSILPYPFILLANIMSIAAPGQTGFGAAPFILLSIYPLIWIVLDVFAWRLLGRGSTAWAFGLSSIPAFFVLAGVIWYASTEHSADQTYSRLGEESRKEIEPLNPLVWKIKCTGGKDLTFNGPQIPIDEAIAAIDTDSKYINVPAGKYGTPLRMALFNLSVKFDGTTTDPLYPGKVRLIRALVAHGAKLGEPTSPVVGDMVPEFRLRLAMMDGPFSTETDNPLVWRILHRDYAKRFELSAADMPLLNKPARPAGTPLHAVLLISAPDFFEQFVTAGARLAPEEEREPATAVELEKMLDRFSELRPIYNKR